MSRSYKRRAKGLRRGTWESPSQRSHRVLAGFYDTVTEALNDLLSLSPDLADKLIAQQKEQKPNEQT